MHWAVPRVRRCLRQKARKSWPVGSNAFPIGGADSAGAWTVKAGAKRLWLRAEFPSCHTLAENQGDSHELGEKQVSIPRMP